MDWTDSRCLGSLSANDAERIIRFLGYGRPAAPIWFIGLEEGLSSLAPSDLTHNLKARGAWDEFMDLDRACLSLIHGGEPIRISIRPPGTPTWRWMAKISLALAGNFCWEDARVANKAVQDYVRGRLGRADPTVGDTFLTELSPIPSKNLAANKEWLRYFRSIMPDCDRLIEQRLKKLKNLLQQSRPKFVF
ncbi:MAG: hypothetical protein WA417_06775, partial [Stellaceae bacterium]